MSGAIAFCSAEEFLFGEELAERRHELVGGRVYAMAGGSERHDLVAGLIYELVAPGSRLRGCRPFTANRLLRTPSGNLYYPDVLVACGPAPHRLYETGPALIVEVLSPSTADIDRREKAVAHAEAEPLQLLLLVDPDARRIEAARPSGGRVTEWTVFGPGEVVATGFGDSVRFYDRDMVPTYPSDMLHRKPALPLHLAPCTTSLMTSTFMPLELPAKADAPPQIAVTAVQWELTVQNTTNAAPPQPSVYPLPSGPTGNQLGALQSIVHNNTEYELGYAWLAAGQNLPLDNGSQPQNVPMYAMQSISTLGQPQNQIIEPTRGFSLPTFLAYDQFGLTELFPLDISFAGSLVNGPVATDVADEFTAFGRPLPAGAQVAVITAGRVWRIGESGKTPLYELRVVTPDGKTSHIAVYAYPVPGLDNFFLDPRDHTAADPVYYLRGVDLHRPPGQYTFNYDTTKAWGRILNDGALQGLAVHPHGYVVGVDYVNHKLYALKLPAEAADSDKAPFAMPLSGEGVREGLMMNPQALTISADGRILILEEGNQRIQAFDVRGNPVPSFSVDQPSFSIARSFSADLDAHQASPALLQAFMANTTPALGAFFVTSSKKPAAENAIIDGLNARNVNAALIAYLLDLGYATAEDSPTNFSVTAVTAGKVWLVANTRSQAQFDVRLLPDKYFIDHVYVYNAPPWPSRSVRRGWTG